MFTLENLFNKIDDCLEDGKQIGICCDKNLASVVAEYLEDYDMKRLHNVLDFKKTSNNTDLNYIIIINCKNGDYEYYIDYYEVNEDLPMSFDEFILIGDRFEDFTVNSTKAKHFFYYDKDINVEDYNWEDEDDYIQQKNTEHKEHYRVKINNNNNNNMNEDKLKCVTCCVDCTNTDCEYQGDFEDCDCAECYKTKKFDEAFTEDCDCEAECEECDCDDEYDEVDYLNSCVQSILSTQGCEECIENIIYEMARHLKNVGWNDRKEYIDSVNKKI